MRLAQQSPDSLVKSDGDLEELKKYMHNLKLKHEEFINSSTSLSNQLINMKSYGQVTEIRTQRAAVRTEVKEFLKMANALLRDNDAQSISNIDSVSVASRRTTTEKSPSAVDDEGKQRVNDVENFVEQSVHQPRLTSPFDPLAGDVPSTMPTDVKSHLGRALANAQAAGQQNFSIPPGFVVSSVPNCSSSATPASTSNDPGFVSTQGTITTPLVTTTVDGSGGQANPQQHVLPPPPPVAFVPSAAGPTAGHVAATAQQYVLPPILPPGAQVSSAAALAASSGAGPIYSQQHVSQPPIGSVPAATFPTYVHPNYQYHPPYNYAPISYPYPQMTGPLPQYNQPSSADLTKHLLTQDLLKDSIEPFDGTSFKFHTWKQQIQAKVGPLSLSPVEVLHTLKCNSAKTPKTLILNKISSTVVFTQAVVDNMWETLEQRFASPTDITNDLLYLLYSFKFTSRGKLSASALGRKLYELHDLAEIVCHNMQYCGELRVLDDARGLRDIRMNLPSEIRDAWRNHGTLYEQRNHGRHPPFNEFIRFLRLQAAKLTNPNYAEVDSSPSGQSRTFTTMKTEVTPSENSTANNDYNSYCPYHKSSMHKFEACKSFQKLPHFKKIDTLKKLGSCFLCLSFGHCVADCKSKVKCSFCSSAHNSILHRFLKNESSRGGTSYNSGNPSEISGGPSGPSSPRASNRTFNNSKKSNNNADEVSVNCTKLCGTSTAPINCSKTVLVNLAHKDNPSDMLRVYCILDDQSNCCLVDERITSMLNVEAHDTEYRLRTCNGLETNTSGKKISGLIVKGVSQSNWISLPDVLTNNHIPNNKHEVGTPEMVRSHPSIASFAPQFHEIDTEAEVFMLVGRNCGQAMGITSYGASNKDLWVYETPLGWALVGRPCVDETSTLLTESDKLTTLTTHLGTAHSFHVADLFPRNISKDFDVFSSFDDDEVIDLSVNDRIFLQTLCLGTRVTENSKIEAPLPLKNDVILPDNRFEVRGRMKHTLQRLALNKENLRSCLESMGKSIGSGYVEQVPAEEEVPPPGKSWVLPIFPVKHPRKNKVRLVFDASARYHGVSLNQNLYSGPDFNNELRGILYRFREQKIAVISDIESMFNNFLVPKSHQDYMRFYWYAGNDPSQPIVQWRVKTHCFGCTSSPAVANFCLRYTTTLSHAEPYSEGKDYIKSSFYIDDGITSTSSPEEAVKILQGAINILKPHGVRLHKILSNSDTVMKSFPESEHADGIHPITAGESQTHATLGVQWDRVSDEFLFVVNLPDKPFTKRGMMSINQSIYDPQGLIAPCILIGRLIQREVLPPKKKMTPELESCGWDDPLPERFKGKWENWKLIILDLANVRVPRCFVPPDLDDPDRELHVYSDASDQAIGFVIYMRVTQGERVSVAFVTGKSKVVPQCATTIPRKELNAATEATQCSFHLQRELRIKPSQVSYYCDSNIVLGYIHSTERRFTKYVTRRVSIIHRHTSPESWKYVRTSDNPADIASRGATPSVLSESSWFTGPDHLWQRQVSDIVCPQPANLPEEVLDVTTAATSTSECSFLYRLANRVSSWTKLLRIMQVFRRLCNGLDRARQRLGCSLAPRNAMVSRAEALSSTLKIVQREEFSDTLNLLSAGKQLPASHFLSSLAPFIDSSGVLRVGGRLKHSSVPFDGKHPILLPSKHPVTHRVLTYCHRMINHQGRHITSGELRRRGYHILHSKAAVKQLISNCVTCRRLRGKLEVQRMADLPPDRLAESPLFTNVGTDIFGHFNIAHGKSTRANPGTRKVYVAIFVCLVSRAVHLELLPSLDAASYWNALRRFIAIRGTPSLIRSDNGGNLVSTKSQLDAVNVSELKGNLEEHSIEWIFNPPYASHFGAAYERKIGSVRRVFEGSLVQLGKRTLTYDEFHTLILEAASIVNNTPMQEVSDDPNDPLPITPGALLTLRENEPVQLGSFNERDLMSYGQRRWRRVQYLAQEFWVRWRRDYLMNLQRRPKWTGKRPSLAKGDIVLLKDKTAKRNHWPLARVECVQTGRDGLVRVVSMRVGKDSKNVPSKLFTRAIHDVVLLLPSPRDI